MIRAAFIRCIGPDAPHSAAIPKSTLHCFQNPYDLTKILIKLRLKFVITLFPLLGCLPNDDIKPCCMTALPGRHAVTVLILINDWGVHNDGLGTLGFKRFSLGQ